MKQLKLNHIYNGDCLELMPYIPDNNVDLVLIDPPYNIGKDKWDKIKKYDEFMEQLFRGAERVLKDNGSFYWFHNDMEKISQFMIWLKGNTNFVFKQMIVWNKRFDEASNKGFLDGFIETNGLRNYQKMAEYILFYTFQDDYKNNKLYLLAVNRIIKYVKDLIYQYKGNVTKANEFYCNWSGKAGNYRGLFFGRTQPVLYTKKQYEGLCKYIESLGCKEKIKSYKDILELYNRKLYEDSRYTFNNQKTHHSVWNYEVAVKNGHITPKPIKLIENIILHSSNEGDTVLDFVIGSGTTAVVCVHLNRNYIGIEIGKECCEKACERVRMEEALRG